jgi:hypothetical protein
VLCGTAWKGCQAGGATSDEFAAVGPSKPSKVSPLSAPLSVDAESRRQGADPLGELDEILFCASGLETSHGTAPGSGVMLAWSHAATT